jgi:uncharacterized protein YdiU (UPF0061 family)
LLSARRQFGFERQPLAAQVNMMTLARCLLPFFERMDRPEESIEELQSLVQDYYAEVLKGEIGEMRRAKLGLAAWDSSAEGDLWPQLTSIMASSGVDYTIFWRQLSHITAAEAAAVVAAGAPGSAEELAATSPMLSHMESAFFDAPDEAGQAKWRSWMAAYARRLALENRPESERQEEMRRTSPKFIPREWMLADAYGKAEAGDFSVLHELMEVLSRPYEEHSAEIEAKYYRRPPSQIEKKAGIAYFS